MHQPAPPPPPPPPSQMIARPSYEKRKGPFLINMWEVDFPCKAGLLRRKVRVCPLCTAGLCRKRVWFCRRLCLHLGYFSWPLQSGGGRGSAYCFTGAKRRRKKDAIVCIWMRVHVCGWKKRYFFCTRLSRGLLREVRGRGGGKRPGHLAAAIEERQPGEAARRRFRERRDKKKIAKGGTQIAEV